MSKFYQTTYQSPLGLIVLASDASGLRGLWFEGQKHERAGVTPADEIISLNRSQFDRFDLDGLNPDTFELDGLSPDSLKLDKPKLGKPKLDKPKLDKPQLRTSASTAALSDLQQAIHWLDHYFSNQPSSRKLCQISTTLRLAPRGTDFQQCVWQCLRQIPYGQTTTYGDLAAQVSRRLGRSQMSARAIGAAVGRNPISLIIPCHRVISKNRELTGYAAGLDKKRWLLAHEHHSRHTLGTQ